MFLLAGCARKEETVLINDDGAQTAESAIALNEERASSPALNGSIKTADELLRNPFLSREEEKEFADAGKAVPIDYLNLSAILYSATAQSKAIINGRILQIGAAIDGKEVTDIRPEAVILKDAASEYIVRLKDV